MIKQDVLQLTGLIRKEVRILLRNKHLLFLLLFPTTVQLLILGATLDPQPHNLKVAVDDRSRTVLSRTLINQLAATNIFQIALVPPKKVDPDAILAKGVITAWLFIAPSYQRDLSLTHKAPVWGVLDAVDGYTAGIAAAYLKQTILRCYQVESDMVQSVCHYLFNPTLSSSWYFVPGVLGGLLTLTGTLVASGSLLKEKEVGTIEQVMMLPLDSWQILFAKVLPIFSLMMMDIVIGLGLSALIFHLPFRGNVITFAVASALYILIAIGIGTLLAAVCWSMRQAQLSSFFINIPLVLFSGAVVPLDTMPKIMQDITLVDPLRYYQLIARSIILKGTSTFGLLPELIALAICCFVVWMLSIRLFGRQLA